LNVPPPMACKSTYIVPDSGSHENQTCPTRTLPFTKENE
jgi:hypothetical protein